LSAVAERTLEEYAVDDWQALLQPGTPLHSRLLALSIMRDQYGWGQDQFEALDQLWERESGWDYRARNPKPGSTAVGIPQMLGKYFSGNPEGHWRDNDLYVTSPEEQIRRGLEYIATGNFGHRNYPFRTPVEALKFHMNEGTY
jgi:hypothetical protein